MSVSQGFVFFFLTQTLLTSAEVRAALCTTECLAAFLPPPPTRCQYFSPFSCSKQYLQTLPHVPQWRGKIATMRALSLSLSLCIYMLLHEHIFLYVHIYVGVCTFHIHTHSAIHTLVFSLQAFFSVQIIYFCVSKSRLCLTHCLIPHFWFR